MAKYRLFAIRFLNRQLHPMFTPPRAPDFWDRCNPMRGYAQFIAPQQ
jgi:hypothetical protein